MVARQDGIACEVVDLRTLLPIDKETILNSFKKTGKALIVHEESADNRGCLGHVALHKLGAVKVKGKETVVVVYGLTSLERHERSSVNESSSEGIVEVSE